MKTMYLYVIIAACMLGLSSNVYAFGDYTDESQEQGQLQGQHQGQDQHLYNKQDLDAKATALSGSLSNADAKAHSDADSKSLSLSGSAAKSQAQNHGDQLTSITTEYEAVAASAAALDLPYCGEGVSAQADEGGFSFGNTNFICESNMALKMSLMLVEKELASAAHFESKDQLDVADVHMVQAHAHMLKAEAIIDEVVQYIDNRSDTASLAATTKDLAWPAMLLGLLVLAL